MSEALAAVALTPGPSLPQPALVLSVRVLLAAATSSEASGAHPGLASLAVRGSSCAAMAAGFCRELGGGAAQSARLAEAIAAALLALQVSQNAHALLRLPDTSWAAQNAAVKAECVAGLWELHTAACRAVHSVLAGGIPRSLTPAKRDIVDLSPLIELPFSHVP